MSLVEQFPYRDRDPSAPGFDLMPDLPIVLRSAAHALSGLALVDSGATVFQLPAKDRRTSPTSQAYSSRACFAGSTLDGRRLLSAHRRLGRALQVVEELHIQVKLGQPPLVARLVFGAYQRLW
jgi:hypothetical protein